MSQSIFKGTKTPRSLTKYNLYRGITDFGTLEQFNIFQSGHSFIKILQYPIFLQKLAESNKDYGDIIKNAIHVLEYEFKGLSGIEDITANTMEIGDGVNNINVINSVKEQSATTISMNYTEKSGSLLAKFTELYLQGIYDTRSTFKHYHGLIEDGIIDDGYENEVFTILYWLTDSTGLKVEKAYMMLGAQLQSSDQSIFNSQKGDHEAKESPIEFTCFLAKSPAINDLANSMTQSMSIIRKTSDMKYTYTVPAEFNR